MVQASGKVGTNNGRVDLDRLFQQVRQGDITPGEIIEQALPISNDEGSDPHTKLFAEGLAWAAALRLQHGTNTPINGSSNQE